MTRLNPPRSRHGTNALGLNAGRTMTTLTAATEGGGGGVGVGWDELERLLRTLEKSSNRLNSLDSIREVIKTNGGLPDAPLRTRLIHAASSCSTDPNSRIASKWLQVIVPGIASQAGATPSTPPPPPPPPPHATPASGRSCSSSAQHPGRAEQVKEKRHSGAIVSPVVLRGHEPGPSAPYAVPWWPRSAGCCASADSTNACTS